MEVKIFASKQESGSGAAQQGAELIRKAIDERGEASMVVATGASQFEMLASLIAEPSIDWSRVTLFHLDEYVGLPFSHPASFRGYLWQRFLSKLPIAVKAYHFLSGEVDPEAECDRVGEIIQRHQIDVAFVGIGENGHLAFNDPPADFDVDTPFLVVELDDECRLQQCGEGWFSGIDEVPRQAMTMSIRQIMKSRTIICTVPDRRKAKAVRATLEGEIGVSAPASILRQHPSATLYLDEPAASLLAKRADARHGLQPHFVGSEKVGSEKKATRGEESIS